MFESGGDGTLTGLALFDCERTQLDTVRVWLQEHVVDPETDALLIAEAHATTQIGDIRYPKQNVRIPQLELALVAAQRRNNHANQGALLGNLGLAYVSLGNTDQAIDLYEQQLKLAADTNDRRLESLALSNLGTSYIAIGYVRKAIPLLKQHLLFTHEIGDLRGVSVALGNLGTAYSYLGKVHRAIALHDQALFISRELGDRRCESQDLGNLALAYATLDEIPQASRLFEQVFAIAMEIGDQETAANALWNFGHMLADQGEIAKAIVLLETGYSFFASVRHQKTSTMMATIAYIKKHGVLPPDRLHENTPILVHETYASEAAIKLFRAIARVATGDEDPRAEVEVALVTFEAHGWHIRNAVHQIWEGERDTNVLTSNLNEAEAQIVEQILETISTMGKLDLVQIIQSMLPILGDIALAAHGNSLARTLAEASLPYLEDAGWHVTDSVYLLWAGQRDEAVLTERTNLRNAWLIRRILALVAEEPRMIFVASSLKLSTIRQEARRAINNALYDKSENRRVLSTALEEQAQEIDQQFGGMTPWVELATELRIMAGRLRILK